MARRTAVFDIDGTLMDHAVLPESVIAGCKHLQEQGFVTTVSTGRGYPRMKDLLGEHFDSIISPEAFLMVEHGTKIVDREGKIVFADGLGENELDHIVAFIQANIHMVTEARFYYPDPHESIQAWCPTIDTVDSVRETLIKKGYKPTVFTDTFEGLRERLRRGPITNVSAKLKSYVVVENLKLHFTRSNIDTIFQDGLMEFVANIADKGKAIGFIAEHFGITVEDLLVAGNAINDVDMLNLSAKTRILVGTEEQVHTVLGYLHDADTLVRVETPAALGAYLQTLS